MAFLQVAAAWLRVPHEICSLPKWMSSAPCVSEQLYADTAFHNDEFNHPSNIEVFHHPVDEHDCVGKESADTNSQSNFASWHCWTEG